MRHYRQCLQPWEEKDMTMTTTQAAWERGPGLQDVAQKGSYPAYGAQDDTECQRLHMDWLDMHNDCTTIRSANVIPAADTSHNACIFF